MLEIIKKFVREEEGQDLVEYALLLAFLALAAITALPTLGDTVNNLFSQSASTLEAGSWYLLKLLDLVLSPVDSVIWAFWASGDESVKDWYLSGFIGHGSPRRGTQR